MSAACLQTEVREEALRLLSRSGAYWANRDRCYYRTASGEKSVPLSARFLGDLALGDLVLGRMGGDAEALKRVPPLVEQILARQDGSGAFRWNLPDPGATHPDGVRDQVDLAMVLETLCVVRQEGLLSDALRKEVESAGLRAAAWLATARWAERPGVIRKRVYEEETAAMPHLDVFNGDALAARAFEWAATLPGGGGYAEEALPFLTHLKERFGRHQSGWWSYAERIDTGTIHPPGQPVPTAFFQAMTIIHLRGLERRLPSLAPVLNAAEDAVAEAVDAHGAIADRLESRPECRGKPNVLIADALQHRHPDKAWARLRYVAARHLTETGEPCDETGAPLEDKWRIWLFSDLARLLRRA